MKKNYFNDYVHHCLKFYARVPNPKFRSEVDKKNWIACDRALKSFSDRDREIILAVYTKGDTIPDNVYKVSMQRNISQDTIWELVEKVKFKIAKCRGLI